MHPSGCECAGCNTPLTPEELGQLIEFLARRGHKDVAFQVVGRVAYEAMMATLQKATA